MFKNTGRTHFKKGNKPPAHKIGCLCPRCKGSPKKLFICLNCLKEFKNYGNRKFCSRICKTDYSKGKQTKLRGLPLSEEHKQNLRGLRPNITGSKHHNWKGGITPLYISERCKFRRTMQKIIFKRDNFTCQICGVYGIDMHVDHIKSWSKYPELRFDINNCRTLCSKCHYKITFNKEMPSEIKTWGHNLQRRSICH